MADTIDRLMAEHEPFRRFFDRSRADDGHATARKSDLTNTLVEDLMVADPITCDPSTTLRDAARIMRDFACPRSPRKIRS